MAQTLQMIEISRIDPHPDNPRKNLGDLTELADSIKANGIMQNLTIIPQDVELYSKKISQKKAYDGRYTAVIGHRRLSGARLAGLTEVPCMIAIMDKKEQVAIMLTENVQRSDLTPIEQSQGFHQLHFDLGESVENISKKTGFSKATINKRLNIGKLDPTKLAAADERGGTLADYTKLEEIKDIEKRNEVLESIGTNDFNWKLKSAVDAEKIAKSKPEFIKIISAFAEKASNEPWEYAFVRNINLINDNPSDFIVPDDAKEIKYFYTVGSNYISIYKERKNTNNAVEKSAEQLHKEQVKKERIEALENIFAQAYELRLEFVQGYKIQLKNTAITERIYDMVMDVIFDEVAVSENVFKDYFKIEKKLRNSWQAGDEETYVEAFKRVMEVYSGTTKLFLISYFCLENKNHTCTYYSQPNFSENDELEKLYKYLCDLGYVMSEDEKALLDGTHELYLEEEK